MRKAVLAACLALLAAACGAREEAAPKQQAQAGAWRVYVTNERSGDLTVFEGPSNRVIATVPLGKRPRGLHLSSDGSLLYVALSGSPITPPGVDPATLPPADKGADGIGVFDTRQMKLVRVLRGVSDPEQVVVSPDGQKLFIASEDTGTLVIWDAEGRELASLPAGGEPEGVAVTPDGGLVYVSSEEDNYVTAVDARTNEARAQIPVSARPRTIAFSSDSGTAYVPGEVGGEVTVIDVRAGKAVGSIALEGEEVRPMAAAVSPDDKLVYLSTGRGRTLLKIDAQTHKTVGQVEVGQRPWGIALSPDGRFVYTANGPSNDVSVVDAQNMKVIARVPAGESPWGVAVGAAP